jgi:predicted glycoside hydrolase/deacetylase ChbG (UPF0249 family)
VLIVNADDWGRSPAETDAALRCHRQGRINSVSAMVFMEDSERAAGLALENGVDVGLLLNFSQPFTSDTVSPSLRNYHRSIVTFLKANKYAQLFYNPFLQKQFAYSCQAQLEEFARLFKMSPTHVDGHHHMHLCPNVLFNRLIPAGMVVRRNFSFFPGEKSLLNRTYRSVVDWWLARRYRLTDYFFDLTQCLQENKLNRVAALARSEDVELMTHPISPEEQAYLMSDEWSELLQKLPKGNYRGDHFRSFAVGPVAPTAEQS